MHGWVETRTGILDKFTYIIVSRSTRTISTKYLMIVWSATLSFFRKIHAGVELWLG